MQSTTVAVSILSRFPREPMRRSQKNPEPKVAGYVGLGLDSDGEKRITRGNDFVLLGGTEQTHERMQETAIKVQENLDRKGKRLQDCSPQEFGDMLREAQE